MSVKDILISSVGMGFGLLASVQVHKLVQLQLESQVRGQLVNYEPGGCTVHVYLIPSCRQWDMLESHTEKRKPSNLLMLFFFFL